MKYLSVAIGFVALLVYAILIDDGSRKTRGWLFGTSEPTHKSLIAAIVDYLDRH